MLRALSIQNFVLIDDLFVSFHNGLAVLTGETGAGKSIILDAINVATGMKASSSLIKNKEKPAVITAEFDVPAEPELIALLESCGITGSPVVFKRMINADGKSRAFINGAISSVSQLKGIARYLIEICGQHEQYGLFDLSEHIVMLDQYASHDALKNKVALNFQSWLEARQTLQALQIMQSKSIEEKSYLEYIIKEVEELNLQPNEETALEEKRKRLSSLEKIQEVIDNIHNKLAGDTGALSLLYSLQRAFAKCSGYFDNLEKQVHEAAILLEDALQQVEKANKDDEIENIDDIEARLFKLKNLARKHNVLSSELLNFLEESQKQLALLENIDDQLVAAQQNMQNNRDSYLQVAELLSHQRKQAAIQLKEAVVREFQSLKMDKADFSINISMKEETHWNINGFDYVQFTIKTNPGMPFGPIANLASGGELSRIMLACKIAMQNVQSVPTMIFDEIDAGISGSVATSVGRKLSELSQLKQVMVVTHQPQVAAFADQHYFIQKDQLVDAVAINISLLNQEDKIKEIARLLSGDHVTNESLKAAESLCSLSYSSPC